MTMNNPGWWTNKDDAEYKAAKMAANGELDVYFDNETMSFKIFLTKGLDNNNFAEYNSVKGENK
jgi:hypothetical protein